MIDIQGFKNVPGDLSVHPEIRARARREGVKQGYTYDQPIGHKAKPVDPNRDTSRDRDMGPIPIPRIDPRSSGGFNKDVFDRDFESNLGPGMAAPAVMEDYYNPKTGERTQVTAGYSPKKGSGWEQISRQVDDFISNDIYKKGDKIVKPTNTPGKNAPDLSVNDFLAGNYENANSGDIYYIDSDKTSLAGDELTEKEARELSPKLNSVLNQIDQGNTSNKIDTSNTIGYNPMARTASGMPAPGPNPKNFAQEYSVALPPTMGGYRKKDMVDLELGREGRISPLVAVGQSKQSPDLGWINDDARGVFGGEMRSYVPGGRGGINVSIRPNIANTNTFNPQNTFTPETVATSNPTLQTAGGDIYESTALGGGPFDSGRDTVQTGTRGTTATGDSGDVISDADISTTADNQSTATTGTGSGQTTATPIYNTPINNTPINNTPINNTPINNTPINNTPIDNTPINNTPIDNTPIDNTPIDNTPITRFSDDFATQQEAENWLNQYYINTLGRDAVFDNQFSDASRNASYWINELSKGISTKDKVMSDIQLNPEFTNRKELVDQYRAVLGRDPLESELDALTGPGGQWLTGDTSAAAISQNQLQQSPEFQGRNELVQLWNQHLGRNPTEAELDKYVGAGGFNLTNYTSADDVLQNVILPQKNQNQGGGSSSGGGGGGSSSGGGGGQSYGGGTQAQNYITNQSAYDAEQASRAQNITHSTTANVDSATSQAATTNLADTSTTVDDWLSDFYAEHGINEGKVDQGGRDYWTKALANKDKATVERDILWAAANN